jgi:hypothetical protein
MKLVERLASLGVLRGNPPQRALAYDLVHSLVDKSCGGPRLNALLPDVFGSAARRPLAGKKLPRVAEYRVALAQ